MDTNNELRLRLRFYKDVPENTDIVLQKFEDYKKFRDDVQNNNVKNRNYSFKPVGNLH